MTSIPSKKLKENPIEIENETPKVKKIERLAIRKKHSSLDFRKESRRRQMDRESKGKQVEKASKKALSKQYLLPQRDPKDVYTMTTTPEAKDYDGFVPIPQGEQELTIMALPIELPIELLVKLHLDYAVRVYAYKTVRGKLVISYASQLTEKTQVITPPKFKVWTYQGYKKNVKPPIDNEVFVFCGDGLYLKNCYIRLSDLESRVSGDYRMLLSDDAAYRRNKKPFDVWDSNGNLFDDVRKYRSFFENWTFDSKFWKFMRIIDNAQRRPKVAYSVLSRFWDDKVDCDIWFYINIPYCHLGKLTNVESTEEVMKTTACETVSSKITAMLAASKLLYWPQFKVSIGSETKFDREKFFLVGRHPNMLYQMFTKKEDFGKLARASKWGLARRPLVYKTDDQTLLRESFLKLVKQIGTLEINSETGSIKRESEGTYTEVSKTKTSTAEGVKRHISQNTVMGNNSANKLMNKLFKKNKGEPNRRAEWLHRSARSYGGLDIQPLESTQTVENLVLGTVQTNTMMLRQEMFVKRFVCNAENIDFPDEEVKMIVRTKLYHGTGDQHTFSRHGRSLWFSHNLRYDYKSEGRTKPNCQEIVYFRPFDRQKPMRFEALLDMEMEEMIYGWKDTGPEEIEVEADVKIEYNKIEEEKEKKDEAEMVPIIEIPEDDETPDAKFTDSLIGAWHY